MHDAGEEDAMPTGRPDSERTIYTESEPRVSASPPGLQLRTAGASRVRSFVEVRLGARG
jgi:hypothetical protein